MKPSKTLVQPWLKNINLISINYKVLSTYSLKLFCYLNFKILNANYIKYNYYLNARYNKYGKEH